jgi:predicted RNA-binding Zn-ribbon protein involved in translation (DUF1610 family)
MKKTNDQLVRRITPVLFRCYRCGEEKEIKPNTYNGFDPDSRWTIPCPHCGENMGRRDDE